MHPSARIYLELLLDSVVHIIAATVRKPVFDVVDHSDARRRRLRFLAANFQAFQTESVGANTRLLSHPPPKAWPRCQAPNTTNIACMQHVMATWGAIGQHGPGVDAKTALQKELFVICFGHAYLHFEAGARSQAHIAFGQALGLAFWHLKVWAYGVLSAIGTAHSVPIRR